jgi:transcriptional regulator with XRE-family HTH domain
MSELPGDLGQRILQLRQRRGLYPRDLAAQAGCTPKHLNNVEAGRKNPSLELVNRLAIALQIDADALLADGFDAAALITKAAAA